MTVELYSELSTPHPCSYLPAEVMRMHYRWLMGIGGAEFEQMLSRGWRRQGHAFFRPACPACIKCRSLRVLVEKFQPTKSQRRALRKNADVTLTVHRPHVTTEHLQLYREYHDMMAGLRDWNIHEMTEDDYTETFLAYDLQFPREFQYRRDGRLIGLGLVDETPKALSRIYFFHAPDWRPLAPGVFTVLKEMEYAQQAGKEFVYLGYWIKENQSMQYKNQYGPHQVLEGFPRDDETPVWKSPSPQCT